MFSTRSETLSPSESSEHTGKTHTHRCVHTHTKQSIQEPVVTSETGNLWMELRWQFLERHLLAAMLTFISYTLNHMDTSLSIKAGGSAHLEPESVWVFCLLKITFFFPTSLQLTLCFYGHCAYSGTSPSQSYGTSTTTITMAIILIQATCHRRHRRWSKPITLRVLSLTTSMCSGSICEASRDKWIKIDFIFPPVSDLLTSLSCVACLG